MGKATAGGQAGPERRRKAVVVRDVSEKEKNTTYEGSPVLTRAQRKVYAQALRALNEAGVTYAVGASFARHIYTKIWRPTKDLDVFVTPEGLKTALTALEEIGFRTEIVETHWLAKAWKDDFFIDLIFGQGHGQTRMTEDSFVGAQEAEVLGVMTRLIPVEEMIASAAYIATRGRFDGGEIVHLILKRKGKLDWERILNRLGDNRQLLLWHLILFDFVYPNHHSYLPKDLMRQLFTEIEADWKNRRGGRKGFRGTLLDPFSYNVDVEHWGYPDQRNTEPVVDPEGAPL
jgi:hypothetical protein